MRQWITSTLQQFNIFTNKRTFPSHRDLSLKLVWYTTLDGVSLGAIGDTAKGICRQVRPHTRFENCEIIGHHRCERWADARPPENGRPVVIEINERPLHVDLPRFDRLQTRTCPQFPHRVYSRCVRAGRRRDCNAQPTHFNLQRLVRKTTAFYVPRVGCDDATRPDNSRHLGNAFGRVGNEENHERHDSRVERVVWERQCHCIALTKLCDTRCGSCARKGELPLRRVYPLY